MENFGQPGIRGVCYFNVVPEFFSFVRPKKTITILSHMNIFDGLSIQPITQILVITRVHFLMKRWSMYASLIERSYRYQEIYIIEVHKLTIWQKRKKFLVSWLFAHKRTPRFSSWSLGYPRGTGDCMALIDGSVVDDRCDARLNHALCQKLPGQDSISNEEIVCGDEWRYFEGTLRGYEWKSNIQI